VCKTEALRQQKTEERGETGGHEREREREREKEEILYVSVPMFI
jgi:hypothetical protein